jgi:hypothetical protein
MEAFISKFSAVFMIDQGGKPAWPGNEIFPAGTF